MGIQSESYGVVYFIGPKDTGPVKIGYTANRDAEKRRAQLQTGSAEEYVVLGMVDAGPVVERAIHELLTPHRVRSEWFEREAALALLSHMKDSPLSSAGERFWIAMADARTGTEQPEVERTPQEELAARVVSDLISDKLREIISLPIAQPIPLRAWLLGQQHRDDPTGDLAKDITRDPAFPPLGTLEEYLRYITDKMSNSSVTRAVFDAWIECVLAIKSLRFRSPEDANS
ncbi:MAG: YozE family protein [Elusimicrobiota bacterium]|nr:YozE family protein [Elusimicrobiota bacterium]